MIRRLVKRVANRLVRFIGTSRVVPTIPPPEVDAADAPILEKVKLFTMTSEQRLIALVDAIRYVCRYRLPGAIVECGVWRGGSSMAAALALQTVGDTSRDMFLYDTFTGMTLPTECDRDFEGKFAVDHLRETPKGTGVWCEAGLDDVRANLASTGYPQDRLRFIPGRVEETIPGTLPDAIAVLRLDTDWYESTQHELKHLYPRLVEGGVLIIDDYGHWQGAKKAVDEFLALLPNPVYLHRIDYTGRLIVKTSK
jgi:O-methyltransferase